MNKVAPSDFSAQLAILRRQFAAQLAGSLDELSGLVAGCGPDLPRELLAQAHLRLHKLAGAGGTFGFHELSTRARALEETSRRWLDVAQPAPLDQWQAWLADLRALQLTIAAQEQVAAKPVALLSSARLVTREGEVVMVHADQTFSQAMCRGLRQFGYTVSSYPDWCSAQESLLTAPPDILLLESTNYENADEVTRQTLARLVGQPDRPVALIFFASHADFAIQLLAAKAGAEVFFTHPIDVPTVASRIESLLREREHPPYRVLIADDDEVLAEHYLRTLRAGGMLADRVSHPTAVLPALQRLRPDVLLMDLYMPECTGAELARMIRYDLAWQSLPIVLLSGESDLTRQVQALASGADDFLVKPISDVELLVSIRVRAERARKVSELMSQDSLTGLLKHASIKERLMQEVDRARRTGKSVSIAMVDIDLFKLVNDNWGHPMGDQVIKTLGNLLRQRLRRHDSVGRYGGEEFLVVLPECAEADAIKLLDDIRQRFADIDFLSGTHTFNISLSAGVATSTYGHDAHEVLAAADQALYEAKNSGRNQVCKASTEDTSPQSTLVFESLH
jgi:diguanylate cyclase (GGDEF)-like protein